MNNEPVAWINRIGKDGEHGYLEWDKDEPYIKDAHGIDTTILRKAQEK